MKAAMRFHQAVRSLLTTGNPKIAKGEGHGYLTAILHFAPHTLSGRNVCPMATKACSAGCLESAGRGGIYGKADTVTVRVADGRLIRTNTIRRARIARTNLYFEAPEEFAQRLEKEIRAHLRRAERNDLTPAIRLNGTSDITWEDVRLWNGKTIFEVFPTVQFYDYTKIPGRVTPANYHLTFSFSGENADAALAEYAAGRSVAVVFSTRKGQTLPAFYPQICGTDVRGVPVYDADLTDLRFLDPHGIAGLRAKGKAKKLPVGGFNFIQAG